jgi:hypothetical protein
MDPKPNLLITLMQLASVSDAGDYPRADIAVDACDTLQRLQAVGQAN